MKGRKNPKLRRVQNDKYIGFYGSRERRQKEGFSSGEIMEASDSHNETGFVCVQAEDELNISLGLLCCCGSVWEEKRARVRERAAVAMVSRGRLA